ncbi:MAG TPA: hypothetical protein VMC10_16570 [Stellaceae bacterium]|nr:hypothetical protein [Stellaceae bacterium]
MRRTWSSLSGGRQGIPVSQKRLECQPSAGVPDTAIEKQLQQVGPLPWQLFRRIAVDAMGLAEEHKDMFISVCQ